MKKENRIKKENYELLFDRIKIAHSNKFYLEQSWIAYAIIEDRISSLLAKSGGVLNHKGEEIRMLGNKISTLEKRNKKNINLRKILYGDILEKLKVWSKSRNDLMHALASSRVPVNIHSNEIEAVAVTGEEIAREISSRARRFKNIITKQK